MTEMILPRETRSMQSYEFLQEEDGYSKTITFTYKTSYTMRNKFTITHGNFVLLNGKQSLTLKLVSGKVA